MLDNYSYSANISDMYGTVTGGTDQTQAAADLSRGTWDSFRCAAVQPKKPEDMIAKDAAGHIAEVDKPDGTIYKYSDFQVNGQPSEIKIVDSKTGDYGQWKREDDGLWRSYDRDKPNYEVVRGEWVVDDKGMMHMNGVQDSLPLPHPRPVSERPHVALSTGHKIGPGPDGLPTSAPEGYRAFRGHISPEVVKEANSLLGGAFGTETPFEINGKKYMARVEPHYHPPGYKGGPNGWHKGVTVYEAKDLA